MKKENFSLGFDSKTKNYSKVSFINWLLKPCSSVHSHRNKRLSSIYDQTTKLRIKKLSWLCVVWWVWVACMCLFVCVNLLCFSLSFYNYFSVLIIILLSSSYSVWCQRVCLDFDLIFKKQTMLCLVFGVICVAIFSKLIIVKYKV